MKLITEVEQAQCKPANKIPKFNIGDTVRVHFRIVEGEKERIQIFEGVVIGRKGAEGPLARFTVRRVAFGEGVERVFPLHSPRVEKVEVTREGHVRRAKLYYLRERSGKAARVKAKGRSMSIAEVVDTGAELQANGTREMEQEIPPANPEAETGAVQDQPATEPATAGETTASEEKTP